MLDPGMGVRPWCARVLGTLVADSSATYTMSCNEQQVPEIHETIGGTLT